MSARGPQVSRREARRRAVEVLYEAQQRETDPVQLVDQRAADDEAEPIGEYTVTIVRGVATHRAHIDELLDEHAQGWTVQRMPLVDAAVLRMGVYELLWQPDVPDPVVIDEAVGIVRELSTDDSPRFVNGVLGRIGGIADRLRAVL